MPTTTSREGAFLVMAVAFSFGWITISSELGRLAQQFGPSILLRLSLAYFLPSLPILVAQMTGDAKFDRTYGAARASSLRAIFGFGGSAVVLATLPLHPETLPWLLCAVAALGVCSSVAFGSSHQLAAGRPSEDTAALALGYVASAPLVLLLEALLRIGPGSPWQDVLALHEAAAAVTLVGLAAALVVAADHRSSLQQPEGWEAVAGQPLLQQPEPGQQQHQQQQQQQQLQQQREQDEEGDEDARILILEGGAPGSTSLAAIWPAAGALMLSVGTCSWVFPLFTLVPSSGSFGVMLPQTLFWVRCLFDTAGRLLPRVLPVRRPATLLALAALKLALAPLLYLRVRGWLPAALCSDWAAVAVVAAQWLLSGLLNSCSYVAAPRLVAPPLRTQAAVLMTLTFQLGCLGGLLLAVPFVYA